MSTFLMQKSSNSEILMRVSMFFLRKSCDDPTQVEEVKLQCVELSRPP